MACCRPQMDDEVIPSCSELEAIEANGYVEVKLTKRRCVFKKFAWQPRYCVLSNGRLYFYNDQKGKSNDRETFVIDLKDTVRMNIHSFIGWRTHRFKETMIWDSRMFITDKYKKKNALRFSSAEERLYWMLHLSRVTGKTLGADLDGLCKKKSIHPSQPGQDEIRDENEPPPPRILTVNESEERSRAVGEYLNWVRRQNAMLDWRERDLCAEIECILPIRTRASSTTTLNTANGAIVEMDGLKKLCDVVPIENATTLEKDAATNSAVDEVKTERPIQEPVPAQNECQPVIVPNQKSDSESKKPSPTPDPTIPEILDQPKKRTTSVGIAKMQEIFSAQDERPRPPPAVCDLRSFTSAKGTVQFPAYRRAHPGDHCHKLVKPPPPKWWPDPSVSNDQKPMRFKNTVNPVWKVLNEKIEHEKDEKMSIL